MKPRRGFRLARGVTSLLSRSAQQAHRFCWWALLLLVALTALALSTSRRLTINADLADLLPASFRSVQDLRSVQKRFGGFGTIAVVAHDAPPEQLEAFAEDLARKLKSSAMIRWVDYRRPTEFFDTHALYYLSVPELDRIVARSEERLQREKQKLNPFYIDLGDPEEESWDDLLPKTPSTSEGRWLERQRQEAYYIDRKARTLVVIAKPSESSTDLKFAKRVVGEVRRQVESLDLRRYGPSFWVEYGGTFTKKVDQQKMLQGDLQIATFVSFALVFLFLLVHFRRLTAVLLILAPLVAGLLWTYASAALLFGTLNILTAFIGAILIGLGIDHGIHLLGRFDAEWSRGTSMKQNLSRTFGGTGRAALLAALTTIVAFVGLSFSEFGAFREFGILAGLGMFLVFVSYIVGLPALLGAAMRLGWKPNARGFALHQSAAGWVVRRGGILAALSCALLVASVFFAQKAEFNSSFRSLLGSRLRSFELDREIDRLLGHSQSPVVVPTKGIEAERQVVDALRATQRRQGSASTIDLVASSADLLPPEQSAKHERIERLRAMLDSLPEASLKPKDREQIQRFRRTLQGEPFDRQGLPAELRRQFAGIDSASDAGMVLVFSSVDLSDGSKVSAFAKELRGTRLPDGSHVRAAGEHMVLADVFDMVSRESGPVMASTLLLVFVAIWLLLGTLRAASLSVIPAVITLLGTAGVVGATRMEFNYLNVIMVPVLFGSGVDGGIHLMARVQQASNLAALVAETGHAIFGALFTTGLGFASLLLANHDGLRSLGELAITGLSINLAACLVTLPAVVAWLRQRRLAGRREEAAAASS